LGKKDEGRRMNAGGQRVVFLGRVEGREEERGKKGG